MPRRSAGAAAASPRHAPQRRDSRAAVGAGALWIFTLPASGPAEIGRVVLRGAAWPNAFYASSLPAVYAYLRGFSALVRQGYPTYRAPRPEDDPTPMPLSPIVPTYGVRASHSNSPDQPVENAHRIRPPPIRNEFPESPPRPPISKPISTARPIFFS